jgi:hypothetical protein
MPLTNRGQVDFAAQILPTRRRPPVQETTLTEQIPPPGNNQHPSLEARPSSQPPTTRHPIVPSVAFDPRLPAPASICSCFCHRLPALSQSTKWLPTLVSSGTSPPGSRSCVAPHRLELPASTAMHASPFSYQSDYFRRVHVLTCVFPRSPVYAVSLPRCRLAE